MNNFQKTNRSVVSYPSGIASLWAPSLESFRYILVRAALATKLLDKYICSAAQTHTHTHTHRHTDTHKMGIKVRPAILKTTAALHHTLLWFDEQSWHSESEEEHKLSAVRVAWISYVRQWAHMSSETKTGAANE